MKITSLVFNALAAVQAATSGEEKEEHARGHPYRIVIDWLANSADTLLARKEGEAFTFFQFCRAWNLAAADVLKKDTVKREAKEHHKNTVDKIYKSFPGRVGSFARGFLNCIGEELKKMRKMPNPDLGKIAEVWRLLHTSVAISCIRIECTNYLEDAKLLGPLNAAIDQVLEKIAYVLEHPKMISAKTASTLEGRFCHYKGFPGAFIAVYNSLEQIITALLTWQEEERVRNLASMFSSFLTQKYAIIVNARATIAQDLPYFSKCIKDFLHYEELSGNMDAIAVFLSLFPSLVVGDLVDYLNLFAQPANEDKKSSPCAEACAAMYLEIVKQFQKTTSCSVGDALSPFVERLRKNCASEEGIREMLWLKLNYQDLCVHPFNYYAPIARKVQELLEQVELLRASEADASVGFLFSLFNWLTGMQ